MGCTPTKLATRISTRLSRSHIRPCHSYTIAINQQDLFKDLKKAACAGNVKLGLEILKQGANVINKADVGSARLCASATPQQDQRETTLTKQRVHCPSPPVPSRNFPLNPSQSLSSLHSFSFKRHLISRLPRPIHLPFFLAFSDLVEQL